MKCVLPQNGTRFAAKWNAFCRKMEIVWPKMERVLAQNGMRFGPKWNAFWPKMENAYARDALPFRNTLPAILWHNSQRVKIELTRLRLVVHSRVILTEIGFCRLNECLAISAAWFFLASRISVIFIPTSSAALIR